MPIDLSRSSPRHIAKSGIQFHDIPHCHAVRCRCRTLLSASFSADPAIADTGVIFYTAHYREQETRAGTGLRR